MREIAFRRIVEVTERLCLKAAFELPSDVLTALERCARNESNARARNILNILCENARLARKESIPICQDTGMAVVFVELGEEVQVVGEPSTTAGASAKRKKDGSTAAPEARLIAAINEGVRRGYSKGYLRQSVVGDPLRRENTGDNTPAVVHLSLVPGKKLRIIVAPKGFGSENMSRLAMLQPTAGVEAIRDFVVDTVRRAGGNPCPPIVVGVGIGGTMETAALNAKRALLRRIGRNSRLRHVATLERELLAAVNATGIGPQGLGGRYTALAVNIETAPTHIAGLPVAVNICCHAARHAEAEL